MFIVGFWLDNNSCKFTNEGLLKGNIIISIEIIEMLSSKNVYLMHYYGIYYVINIQN